MQAYSQPLLARSNTPVTKSPRRIQTIDTAPLEQSPLDHWPVNQDRRPVSMIRSPFQAALLFTAEKQHHPAGFDAYVGYLSGQQLLSIERLHRLRGPNPAINLTRLLIRARQSSLITGVILATWQHSTSEYPYAGEFIDEVYRQYELLAQNGITLIDHLRLSETGVFSYYGGHKGPYSNAPSYHEKSICRLY